MIIRVESGFVCAESDANYKIIIINNFFLNASLTLFSSGCIACHGFSMRHDLYGAGESGLDAALDLMA